MSRLNLVALTALRLGIVSIGFAGLLTAALAIGLGTTAVAALALPFPLFFGLIFCALLLLELFVGNPEPLPDRDAPPAAHALCPLDELRRGAAL